LGVPEDSKSPLLGVGVAFSHFAQSGVATIMVKNIDWNAVKLMLTKFVHSYYLELVSEFKSSNESMIKTPKQQTLIMETKLF
jgi:hypothetical protein